MTLQTRVVLAFGAVFAVLLAAFTSIVILQRASMIGQLDHQLDAIATNVTRLSERGAELGARQPLPPVGDRSPFSSDLFVALIDGDGTMDIFAQPLSDPGFRPVLPEDLRAVATAQPMDTPALTGDYGARTIVVDLGSDRFGIFSVSTGAIEQSQEQLIATSLGALVVVFVTLAAVAFWLDRLGLNPIKNVTRAAEESANGAGDKRVPIPSAGTEAGRLAATFNTMLDARQEAERRQRQFVADAAHELRTPVTTLLGYTSLYQHGGLSRSDQVDDAMRRIHSEAGRMSTLVQDLLTLAALDEQRPLNRSTVDVSRLVFDIATDASVVQTARSVTTDVAEGLTAELDEHLITQAISTVTTNSLRHTPTSSPLRIVARADSMIGPGEPCDAVRIEVIDGGPGIPADRLQNVFDRFNRADVSRSRTGGGTGLGLSIARSVVAAHGGHIDVTSAVDLGTKVTICLPVAGKTAPVSGSTDLAGR